MLTDRARSADAASKEIHEVIDKVVEKMESGKAEQTPDQQNTVVKRSLLQSLILSRREAMDSSSKVPLMPIDQIKGNIIHVLVAGFGKLA